MGTSSSTARKYFLDRTRLSKRFAPGLVDFPSILLLNAPAGFGKSTLAVQLIAEVSTDHTQVIQVRCSKDPHGTLWGAIRSQVPSDSTRVQSDQNLTDLDWVRNYGGRIVEPTLLVVHNYHYVTNAETDMALQNLGESSPNLHILVLARNVRLLNGPLCATTVRTIGQKDLAFNATEMKELASRSSSESQKHVDDALLLSEGWPLAVRAILDANHSETEVVSDSDFGSKGSQSRSFHAGLTRLAFDSLELLGEESREVMLAASLTTTLSLNQAANLLKRSDVTTQHYIDSLLELGLLRRTRLAHGSIFRAHPAIQPIVSTVAMDSLSDQEREEIIFGSAREREAHDPISAFRMYLESSFFDEAEQALAAHFTRMTDEPAACAVMLSTLSDSVLRSHPTFAAARFMLEFADSTVPYVALRQTLSIMSSGAKKRLASDAGSSPVLLLAHQVQVMIGERMKGNLPAALQIAQGLESNVEVKAPGGRPSKRGSALTGDNAQPAYLSEIGLTAFIAGDYGLAKRVWSRMEALTQTQPVGSPSLLSKSLATTTSMHGAWRQAALNGLSICAANDGDFAAAAGYLDQADTLREEIGDTAPLLAWVNGEVTRAHLAYQDMNEEDLHLAVDRVEPWNDRIEQWSMLLQAETETTRYLRGPGWALSQLDTSVARIREERRNLGAWSAYLALYRTALNTILGNFTASGQILSKLPSANVFVQFEKVRLALYSERWPRALLLVQQIGVAGLSQRQLIDRSLMAAISAWKCNMQDEAYEALRQAGALIRSCNLSMMLRSVPFEALEGVTQAAKNAGVCDLSELVAAVPVPARSVSRENLTRTEQLTLEMMVSHPTLSEAAEELDISPATVKRHRLTVYRKLRVNSRDEAIVQATRLGLLSIDEVAP